MAGFEEEETELINATSVCQPLPTVQMPLMKAPSHLQTMTIEGSQQVRCGPVYRYAGQHVRHAPTNDRRRKQTHLPASGRLVLPELFFRQGAVSIYVEPVHKMRNKQSRGSGARRAQQAVGFR